MDKEVAYIGDDVSDLEIIRKVGTGCLRGAVNGMVNSSLYVTTKRKEGILRKIADYLLIE